MSFFIGIIVYLSGVFLLNILQDIFVFSTNQIMAISFFLGWMTCCIYNILEQSYNKPKNDNDAEV